MKIRTYITFGPLGTSDPQMEKSVPVGIRSPTPWARRHNSLDDKVIHMSLSRSLIRCLYSLSIPVSELMTELANWGLTGFSMGLSIMVATKLVDAFFMHCFSLVL